jgi:hypothetical protein
MLPVLQSGLCPRRLSVTELYLSYTLGEASLHSLIVLYIESKVRCESQMGLFACG